MGGSWLARGWTGSSSSLFKLACGWTGSSSSLQASPGARGWMKSFYFPDSGPVLSFPGLEFWCARWDLGRVFFVERSPSARESAHPSRLSSATRKGEQGPRQSARSPNTARSRQSARPFCHDSARTSGPTRTTRKGKSRLPFFFFSFGFLCKCLWEGACRE